METINLFFSQKLPNLSNLNDVIEFECLFTQPLHPENFLQRNFTLRRLTEVFTFAVTQRFRCEVEMTFFELFQTEFISALCSFSETALLEDNRRA